MVETNITRRRVMQGAGAVGIAGVVGSTVVTAQDDNETDDENQAALRVAHATPDAPGVDVRIDGDNQIEGLGFREVSDYNELEEGSHQVEIVVTNEGLIEGVLDDLFGGDEDEDETVIFDEQLDLEAGQAYTAVAFGEIRRGPVPAEGEDTTTGNETDVGGNATDTGDNESDLGTDNDTDVGGNATDTGGNDTDVGGNATDTGGAAGGQQVIENLSFGEEDSFEMAAGDYTLEIREAQAAAGGAMTDGGTDTVGGNDTDTGAGNDTDIGGDDNETVGTTGNDTDVGGNDTDVGTDNETDIGGDLGQEGADRGFQVKLLEDDLTSPGEDQFRLRIFHAVPDVDAISITATESEGDGGLFDGGGGNESDNETGGNATGGNDTGGDLGGDNETGGNATGNETAGEGENVQQRDISPSGAGVYSGFGVGYFDPEAAAGNQTGNESDGGVFGGDNESGNDTGGNDTGGDLGGDNETGGNATGNETEEIAEDPEGEEFELVTVKDSDDGERVDGGTGGGLF